MKYFIDTHDKSKGSFPAQELTEQEFFDQFAALEKAAHELGVFGHAAHVNLKEGKAFCFMSGPDEESIRKAHAAINLPYDRSCQRNMTKGFQPGSFLGLAGLGGGWYCIAINCP